MTYLNFGFHFNDYFESLLFGNGLSCLKSTPDRGMVMPRSVRCALQTRHGRKSLCRRSSPKLIFQKDSKFFLSFLISWVVNTQPWLLLKSEKEKTYIVSVTVSNRSYSDSGLRCMRHLQEEPWLGNESLPAEIQQSDFHSGRPSRWRFLATSLQPVHAKMRLKMVVGG